MNECPACHFELPADATDCAHCGIVLAKWKARPSRPAPGNGGPPRRPVIPPAPRPETPLPVRILVILALGLVGGGAVVGGYYWFKIRPRLAGTGGTVAAKPGKAVSVEAESDSYPGFDLAVTLPSEPIGLAWDGKGFVACNRKEPWGFLQMTRRGRDYEIRKVPVVEPTYNQNVGLDMVTWNGSQFVGYAMGSWFQSSDPYVFTLHDAGSLQIVRHVKAPEGLGAIAWDGTGYWAASRNNTDSSGEKAALYRLSADLEIERALTPPGVGCQGLAWDGQYLWFADVFADAIYQLDVSGSDARTVGTYPMPFDYLSGVAWDGKSLWVAEYAKGRLHQVGSEELGRWTGRPVVEVASAESDPYPEKPEGPPPEEAEKVISDLRAGTLPIGEAMEKLRGLGRERDAVPVLQDLLWIEDPFLPMRAGMALDQMGVPKSRARDKETGSLDLGPEDTELVDWKIEVQDGTLRGWWRIHMGQALFQKGAQGGDGVVSIPCFARYTLTVKGGTLPREIEKEYEGTPGENTREGEVLATGLGPGKYSVSVFIHVQYVDPSGQARILNNNAGWLEVES